MKYILLTLLLSFFSTFLISQEKDPFAENPTEEVKPHERKIEALPKSVIHTITKEGKHIYTVNRIYNTSEVSYLRQLKAHKLNKGKIKVPNAANDPFAAGNGNELAPFDPESMYQGMVDLFEDLSLDFKNRILTITTNRKLSFNELANGIDQLAWIGGDIPFWVELEARNTPRSKQYDRANFTVSEYKKEMPEKLAWFSANEESPIITLIRLVISYYEQGRISITPTTAFCMCHNRFAIRIVNSSDEIIWENQELLFGNIQFALSDLDGDEGHEILIQRNDHGKGKVFLIQPAFKSGEEEIPANIPNKESNKEEK